MNDITREFLQDLPTLSGPPRVHGNGFIQLDIDHNHRLNFWGHPDIPCQAVKSDIHDHTFSFVSKILKGEMHNFNYETTPAESGMNVRYKIYNPQARDRQDTILVYSGEKCSIRISSVDIVNADHSQNVSYHMLGGKLHNVVAYNPSITLMKYVKPMRTLEDVPPARVLVRLEEEPDNVFNRNDYNEEFLWNIIDEICED